MKIGKYRHYKGGEYEAICFAFHTETCEEMVIYKPLDALPDDIPGFNEDAFWVRPKKMFEETVMVDGEKVPRFQFLSLDN